MALHATSPSMNNDKNWGGADSLCPLANGCNNQVTDQRTNTRVQTLDQIRQEQTLFRNCQQEEVLGYDNTMLLSRAELSDLAKSVLEKQKEQ